MEWDDIRFFLALARTGAVRAAGGVLKVSHSTVSRRVEALETRLGTRLFDRDRDGYRLTDAGREMVPGAEAVEEAMSALERRAQGQDERFEGPVRLTCCDEFVGDILLEALAGFCAQHPGIDIAFSIDSRAYDLSKREADIALRILPVGASPPEHLIGQNLVPIVYASYVAVEHRARLVDRSGRPARFVGFADQKQAASMVATSSHPDVPIWGAFSSIALMLQAALRGFGAVMLPAYLGDVLATLQRLEKPDVRHPADLWLVSHPDLRENVRLRATRACLSDALKERDALFRGDSPRPVQD